MAALPRAAAREAPPAYSRRDVPRHQLFAALAGEVVPGADYRGAGHALGDFAERRGDRGLRGTPAPAPPRPHPAAA